MEGFVTESRAAQLLATALADDRFMLIDVGCSGGIDAIWRILGERLSAFGFDPNVGNCRELTALETNPNIRYVPGFVGIPANHPFAQKRNEQPVFTRNPWPRFSIARTLEIMSSAISAMSDEEKRKLNAWKGVELANPNQAIYLPEFFLENQIDDIDFLKIDIDGHDFDVLNSIEGEIGSTSILGIGMEVNFIGGPGDTEHSFHNTDRFMRRLGFELMNLTVRRYSLAALPGPYLSAQPSLSQFGRPFQGDALYVRDPCAEQNAEFAQRLSASKLIKAAVIYAVAGLPDHAAEILLRFRSRLEARFKIEPILNALAEEASPSAALSYRKYQEAFERNDPIFYPPVSGPQPGDPPPPPPPTIVERLLARPRWLALVCAVGLGAMLFGWIARSLYGP